MLADVFRTFKICLEIYEFNYACFLTESALALQAVFKKTKAKLDNLSDNDILLMVPKWIIRWICNGIHWQANANNKYMKDYNKNK